MNKDERRQVEEARRNADLSQRLNTTSGKGAGVWIALLLGAAALGGWEYFSHQSSEAGRAPVSGPANAGGN